MRVEVLNFSKMCINNFFLENIKVPSNDFGSIKVSELIN